MLKIRYIALLMCLSVFNVSAQECNGSDGEGNPNWRGGTSQGGNSIDDDPCGGGSGSPDLMDDVIINVTEVAPECEFIVSCPDFMPFAYNRYQYDGTGSDTQFSLVMDDLLLGYPLNKSLTIYEYWVNDSEGDYPYKLMVVKIKKKTIYGGRRSSGHYWKVITKWFDRNGQVSNQVINLPAELTGQVDFSLSSDIYTDKSGTPMGQSYSLHVLSNNEESTVVGAIEELNVVDAILVNPQGAGLDVELEKVNVGYVRSQDAPVLNDRIHLISSTPIGPGDPVTE